MPQVGSFRSRLRAQGDRSLGSQGWGTTALSVINLLFNGVNIFFLDDINKIIDIIFGTGIIGVDVTLQKEEPMSSFRSYFKKGAKKAGSGNKLGYVLGTSGANISRILMGRGFCDDYLLLKLAEYLGEDPIRLLLLRSVESCPRISRPHWKEVIKRYAAVALIILCTLPSFLVISSSRGEAAVASKDKPFMHYQTLIRDTLKRIASLIGRLFPSEMIFRAA
jgi:hypothetical protein